MNNDDYSLTLLGDALFEVLHNSDLPTERIVEKIKDVLKESETHLESQLDRSRDLLRHFDDDTEELDLSEWDIADGYEWTPLPSKSKFTNLKSHHYWDINRNR